MSEMEKAAETAAEDVKDEKKKADEAWKDATPELKKEIMDFAEGYMRFLDDAKTEREAVRTIVSMADAAGFRNINDAAELKPGDCVYGVNKNKSIYRSYRKAAAHAGLQRSRRPHRRAETRPQAEPALRGQRPRSSQDALLRRYKKIPVDDSSPGASRSSSSHRRYSS